MEPPDQSFAEVFNVPQEYSVLVFGKRRAAISLPFQIHRLRMLVEAGLVAFSSACFEFADEVCISSRTVRSETTIFLFLRRDPHALAVYSLRRRAIIFSSTLPACATSEIPLCSAMYK